MRQPNPFPFSHTNKRYHTWDHFLKEKFGGKVAKIALDAGFSCPNFVTGGCSYCMHAVTPPTDEPLMAQFLRGQQVMAKKWPDIIGWIPYFQANTNTFAPVKTLKETFEPFLALPDVVGLAIATRADALPDDVCDYLQDLSRRTYLLVELGLQTVHDETAERIGRGHSYADFLAGFERLQARGIDTCVHIIDGLPGEDRTMMLETAKELRRIHPQQVKIHLLHILRGTRLADEYNAGAFAAMERDDYVCVVCDQLELLPQDIVIQRLTGDGVRDQLIAPLWSLQKMPVLNEIDKELARRGSMQGKYADE